MFEVLLETTLRSTAIAAAVLLALPLLRVRVAAVRHRVWTVVLIAMLLLPAWVAWGPQIALPVLPQAASSASSTAVAPTPAAQDMMASMARVATPAASPVSSVEPVPPAPRPKPLHWRTWVLALYVAGASVLLARLALGMARVRVLARDARVVHGHLTSARIATPVTVGPFTPQVFLPEGWEHWPLPRLAAVLEHERAHVRRRDPLVQWLALLNRALFWFHPLAWWLERRLAALAEEACDAAVLAGGHEPTEYSAGLLELARAARRHPVLAVVGMAMPGNALQARITKILDGAAPRPGSRMAAARAAAVAALAAAVLGAVTLAQDVGSPPSSDGLTPLPEHWLGDDEWHLEVATLMTPEEKEAYSALRRWEDRDRFIGEFWRRRDPTPGTLHNELRKEHERRIHYAQQWLSNPDSPGSFGYQTTRGGAYVLFGHPDSIDSATEDGVPVEYWHYSDLDGAFENVTVRVALARSFGGCGPGSGFEIVAPPPSELHEGVAVLGGDAERMAVRLYPDGLVTMSIPAYNVQRIRSTLERDAGPPLSLGELFLRNPRSVPPPGVTWPILDYRLSCTRRMPPGRYRLVTDVNLHTGEHVTDGVAFEVRTP